MRHIKISNFLNVNLSSADKKDVAEIYRVVKREQIRAIVDDRVDLDLRRRVILVLPHLKKQKQQERKSVRGKTEETTIEYLARRRKELRAEKKK